MFDTEILARPNERKVESGLAATVRLLLDGIKAGYFGHDPYYADIKKDLIRKVEEAMP
jgi:hypothetical protein